MSKKMSFGVILIVMFTVGLYGLSSNDFWKFLRLLNKNEQEFLPIAEYPLKGVFDTQGLEFNLELRRKGYYMLSIKISDQFPQGKGSKLDFVDTFECEVDIDGEVNYYIIEKPISTVWKNGEPLGRVDKFYLIEIPSPVVFSPVNAQFKIKANQKDSMLSGLSHMAHITVSLSSRI